MIEHRNLFGPQNPFDDRQEAVTYTGAQEPVDSSDALSSHLSQSRKHETAYRTAQANATGVFNTQGSAGLGIGGDDVDSALSREGSVPPDSNDQAAGVGTAGTDSLVQRDTLPKDSNIVAGGRTTGI